MTSTDDTSNAATSVEDLVQLVREWSAELGTLPSRNRVMSRFRVGAPKANAALDGVKQTGFETEATQPAEPSPARRLRAVHDNERQAPPPKPQQQLGEEADAAPPDEDSAGQPASSAPIEAEPPRTATHPHPVSGLPPPHSQAAMTSPEHSQSQQRPTAVATSQVRSWPLLLLALPAFVSIWSGWVGLGELAGFGIVHPLPGIWDDLQFNTAVTLPVGVEAYAAFALRVWLAGDVPERARHFARISAIGSLSLGALGQISYHLLNAAGITTAPWWITTLVACLPVAVLGTGAALAHLLHDNRN